MLILDPAGTDKELEKTLGEVKGLITEHGFKILDEDIWGHRDLAYKIKKHTTGYYVVMLFEGEPAGMMPLKKDLRIQAGLVRDLISKMPEDYVLMRYDSTPKTASGKKLNKHAEELAKKVTGKAKPAKEEEPKSEEESKDLDEKLEAIVKDADIDL